MIDRSHDLPISRQAKVLKISRSSVYYRQKSPSAEKLRMMHHLDRLHLAHPFAGTRMLRDLLRQDGFDIGRDKVRTLMRNMGIQALYRRPRTTKPAAGHRIYPYLLRGLQIDRPNQVWAMDISYRAPSLQRRH